MTVFEEQPVDSCDLTVDKCGNNVDLESVGDGLICFIAPMLRCIENPVFSGTLVRFVFYGSNEKQYFVTNPIDFASASKPHPPFELRS